MFDNVWKLATYAYILGAIVTFTPVLIPILQKINLHAGGDSFDKSEYFDEKEKEMLKSHYSRILGTLAFWKNQALKFKRFHYYVLCWTIPSAVLVPVIIQSISISNINEAKLFLTIVSTFTAILLSFHKGLKVEDNFKAYRHGESEFFDTYRRLLDRPNSFGSDKQSQISEYTSQVESIRRTVRNAETDNLAMLDDGKSSNKIIQGNMKNNI